MAVERQTDCLSRTINGTAAGGVFGAILGAVTANWSDVPKVIRNKSWPAFKQTGAIMAQQGGTFAALGAAYTAADCASESVRGKKDAWNGVVGGLSAGAVIGLRAGSLHVAVGASTALAIVSAIVEVASQETSSAGLFNDNLTPPRTIYPYPRRSANEN